MSEAVQKKDIIIIGSKIAAVVVPLVLGLCFIFFTNINITVGLSLTIVGFLLAALFVYLSDSKPAYYAFFLLQLLILLIALIAIYWDKSFTTVTDDLKVYYRTFGIYLNALLALLLIYHKFDKYFQYLAPIVCLLSLGLIILFSIITFPDNVQNRMSAILFLSSAFLLSVYVYIENFRIYRYAYYYKDPLSIKDTFLNVYNPPKEATVVV